MFFFPPNIADSAEDCQARCTAVAGCAHFSWSKHDGKCHLEDKSAVKTDASGVIAGPPKTTGADSVKDTSQNSTPAVVITHASGAAPDKDKDAFEVEADVEYVPLDMDGQPPTENSLEKCHARCSAVQGCAHFSWEQYARRCHLQESSAVKTTMLGVLAGPEEHTEPPPGPPVFAKSTKYAPLDSISGMQPTIEDSAEACQQRCTFVKDCAHFSWSQLDKGCHLESSSSVKANASGFISGPPLATTEEDDQTSSGIPWWLMALLLLLLVCLPCCAFCLMASKMDQKGCYAACVQEEDHSGEEEPSVLSPRAESVRSVGQSVMSTSWLSSRPSTITVRQRVTQSLKYWFPSFVRIFYKGHPEKAVTPGRVV
jgi:hypothetical protein